MGIELCKYYDVEHGIIEDKGHYEIATIKPICRLGHKAGLKCHSNENKCSDYSPQEVKNE